MIARQAKTSLDITVLLGGPSRERTVSCMSGEAIANALQQRGHRVTRSDIDPRRTEALDREEADLVFIALHGEFGESGEVQQLCEERGLRYTGSGPLASRLGMDKAASKQIFKRAGLATPDWMIIERFHRPEQVCKWLDEIELPVVVKPVDGGSSVDITICRDERTRIGAMDELIDTYGRAMIERYVSGREMTVGILGEEALPVLEIRPHHDFYDYTAKYADDAGTEYTFEHGLDEATVARMQREALTAHRELGCRDFSRVDFILDAEGVPQVLEINTIPGFTSHSLLPKAAERAGVSFDELVDRIAKMAMAREICPAV
jgi:D-alanine-D-alanine ligase